MRRGLPFLYTVFFLINWNALNWKTPAAKSRIGKKKSAFPPKVELSIIGKPFEKSRNEKMKKLWSDLVVQRNRWAYPAQNFELYHMGMVSGVLVLMGVAKVGFFMIVWPFFDGFHEHAERKGSDFGFSGWEWYQMIGLGRGEVPSGFSAWKTWKNKEKINKKMDKVERVPSVPRGDLISSRRL